MANIIFIIWIFVNLLLFLHVMQEFILMIRSLIPIKKKDFNLHLDEYPKVTIQLPLFNEKYVVERLLNAVSKIEYPKDKLEIQILDDSTDETSEIIKDFLIKHGSETTHFKHIQREDRTGFKAGALAYGMTIDSGEFIAIFDADFIPSPDFLKTTIPHFENKEVGVVQTRWEHINECDSLLTRAQALMLNAHFAIEHLGRSRAKGFINFNGTAGVWRKTCIEESGGWQADTLTEDLDLSFRAQALGWKFEYLFDVCSPSELPVTFNAFRTQQYRWSKGAAECLRKNFRLLWKAKVSFSSKVLGTFHLMNSSVYLLVVAIMLLSPAVYFLNQDNLVTIPYSQEIGIMGGSIIYLLFFIFLVGTIRTSKNKLKSILLFIPSLLTYFSMTTGISLYMVVGVLEGYRAKKSDFIRTPKFGSSDEVKKKIRIGYDFKKEQGLAFLEFLFLSYGAFWIVLSAVQFNLMSLIYGILIFVGFGLSLFFKNQTFRWSK